MATIPDPEPAPARSSNNGLRAALAVLGGAVVALGVALIVVTSSAGADRDKQTHRIDVEQKQLATLRTQVQQAEQQATGPSGEVTAKLTQLRRRVTSLENCIPEIQDELNSMTVDQQSLFVSPSAQVSRVCQKVVYGQTTGGE